MTKYIKLGCLIIAIVLFDACSGNKDEVEIKAENIEINGDLNSNIKIPNGTYKVSNTKNDLILNLKVEFTNTLNSNDFEELSVEFIDKDKTPIVGIEKFEVAKGLWSTNDGVEKIEQGLKKGSGNSYIQLVCAGVHLDEDKLKIMELIKNNAVSFIVNTKLSKQENTQIENNVNDNNLAIIRDFVQAENNRNIDLIMGSFSNNIERYYKVQNPSTSEVRSKYLQVWDRNTSSTNTVKSITKQSDGSYLLITDFNYKLNGENKQKSNCVVEYRLDENNKITSITNDVSTKPIANNTTNNTSNNTSTTTDDFSNSGDENFDKYLDDYEKLMDEYMSFLNKSVKGDFSAMSQASSIMEKAEALDRDMKNAKSNNKLNSQQVQRLMKLEAKLLNASAELMSNLPKMK
jgi:hypothetical protein